MPVYEIKVKFVAKDDEERMKVEDLILDAAGESSSALSRELADGDDLD